MDERSNTAQAGAGLGAGLRRSIMPHLSAKQSERQETASQIYIYDGWLLFIDRLSAVRMLCLCWTLALALWCDSVTTLATADLL